MAVIASYDFLQWTSFPSSLKATNDQGVNTNVLRNGSIDIYFVPVKSPADVRVECYIKTEGAVPEQPAWLALGAYDAEGNFLPGAGIRTSVTSAPNWVKCWAEGRTPKPTVMYGIRFKVAGSGKRGVVATTWFDDLKIYQDGKLIYENKFSNWNPYLGALGGGLLGVVGGYLCKPEKPMVPALAGLAVGSLLGAGVGLATVTVKK